MGRVQYAGMPRRFGYDAGGPVLRHGLQGLMGRTLQFPWQGRDRLPPEFLEARYEQFRHAEPG